MILKPADAITWADLLQLNADQRPEDRRLEYKRDLVGQRDADKKEFLADVSALANAEGGDLIYGVHAVDGVPRSVDGVRPDSPDAEKLRLENLLRDGLSPRIIGHSLHWIADPAAPARGGILIRTPASLAAPHRVVFQNSNRFYIRNATGKHEMDVHELRGAFIASAALEERIAALHEDIVTQWHTGQLPFDIVGDPKAVVSLIPIRIAQQPYALSPTYETACQQPLGGSTWLPALEGIYRYEPSSPSKGFALTRRTGQVDFCWRIGGRRDDENLVFPLQFERELVASLEGALNMLRRQGVDGPWVVAISAVGVGDHRIVAGNWTTGHQAPNLRRQRIRIPAAMVEGDFRQELIPAMRLFWAAFHEERPDAQPVGSMAQ
ncbi:ATP-binding protein [Phenylobacterium sp.]|uniref:AlbA family DNA-binding domain-containing protein n=1 Tax=Phenylobacterium sp. TaxID=1871053 RepID=UPI002E2FB44A|nr:ATP-binding protein [Phenylobacterium sp.]HEX4710282.1 ATP-binding protein [Phenylobacterium sp.]